MGGGLSHRLVPLPLSGFSSSLLFRTENPLPAALSLGDTAQACRRGPEAGSPAPGSRGSEREEGVRASQDALAGLRGWAGSAADGAGGGGEQMDGAPDGSGSPGPVQVAPTDSRPAAGAGEGRAARMGRGPRFP